jgi:hypothetical protein
MIHTDEDDEFERIARENNMKGQPYHFDPVYVSPSQRNQVLEEAAKVVDAWSDWHGGTEAIAKAIRGLKK